MGGQRELDIHTERHAPAGVRDAALEPASRAPSLPSEPRAEDAAPVHSAAPPRQADAVEQAPAAAAPERARASSDYTPRLIGGSPQPERTEPKQEPEPRGEAAAETHEQS